MKKQFLSLLLSAALLLGLHHIARWYGTRAGGVLYVLYIAQYFVLMLPAGVLCWLCPLLGRFEYGVRDLFGTALRLTVLHLPSTVVMVLLIIINIRSFKDRGQSQREETYI